jgi:opacity protein-like surface antigen
MKSIQCKSPFGDLFRRAAISGIFALATSSVALAEDAKPKFNEGFYVGGMVGYADAHREPLYNDGIRTSAFGGNGGAASLLMGYDWWVSDIMLGAELEYGLQDVRAHSAGTGSGHFSMPRTFGASVKAGAPIAGQVLPYVKLGVVSSDISAMPIATEGAVTDALFGVKFGAGLDVPVGNGWTWKSEFTHTRYQGWSRDYPNASSSYKHISFNDNATSTILTGVSYGFGAGRSVVGDSAAPAEPLNGVYLVGQIGWGGTDFGFAYLGGNGKGDDFYSSTGLEGSFGLGYRTNLGDWFVAPELEVSRTDNQYRTQNAAGTTTYRLEKKWEADAAVRGGYAVTERLGVYGKVGAAMGRFEFADTSAPGYYDDKNLYGLLLGAGVEYNINGNVALRAEYVHRMFNNWSTTDNNGAVEFDPKSGTTKIGVAYYF